MMPRRDPVKRQGFYQDINLLAVRWNCRDPPSYQDVVDLIEERGVVHNDTTVDVDIFGHTSEQIAVG